MTVQKRYPSPNEFSRTYGIPIVFIRREIKKGVVPGFYSGTWFHIDALRYLEILSNRNATEDK